MEISVPTGSSDSTQSFEADELAAVVASRLSFAGSGLELRDAEIVFWVLEPECEARLAETRTAVASLAAEGWPLDADRVATRSALPEADWREAVRRHFRTERLTRQIVVVPRWDVDDHCPQPDDITIRLEPGMAFGTGAHASTRLILLELQRLRDATVLPTNFADIGTGSGILSIAAAKLWACSGVAMDIDPTAVRVARENIEHNGETSRIVCSTSLPTGRFELVVANIQRDILLSLRSHFAACTAPGGTLVLSGLLTKQADEVAAQFCQNGFELDGLCSTDYDREWTSVTLRRQ